MEDIIKIFKSLEDSGLLLKGVNERVQDEAREQRGGFLSMLLGTLGASLLANVLTGKGATARSVSKEIKSKSQGRGINRAGEGVVRVGYGNETNAFLMSSHDLTNYEIQKYYQNESRFNGVYYRDDLPKIKDGAYVINLDEYSDIGNHWVTLYVQNNDVTYFDSFGVEHIPKET